MAYILERRGWQQWYDDGGRWQGNRDAARAFQSREAAQSSADALNEEFAIADGKPCDDVIVVEA